MYGVLLYLALSGQKEVGLCVVAHACNPSFLKGDVEGGGEGDVAALGAPTPEQPSPPLAPASTCAHAHVPYT